MAELLFWEWRPSPEANNLKRCFFKSIVFKTADQQHYNTFEGLTQTETVLHLQTNVIASHAMHNGKQDLTKQVLQTEAVAH